MKLRGKEWKEGIETMSYPGIGRSGGHASWRPDFLINIALN